MTTLFYTMPAASVKNVVIKRENITNFEEKEHGIYFDWMGAKQFVNWSYIVQYSLIEE